jgi:prevent-host-death family protein
MTQSVTATELAKNFGRWIERAIREPVAILRHGRESAYLISAEDYHHLKRLERRALGAEDVSDEVADLIAGAEYDR